MLWYEEQGAQGALRSDDRSVPAGGAPGAPTDATVPVDGGAVAEVLESRGLGDRAAWSQRDLTWEELVEEARRLGPDPTFDAVTDHDLEHDVCAVAAEVAALTARWLDLLCELVVRGIWADQGARTPAQWLSWKVGLAPSTARDHVRVAVRLRELPRVREAFASGELSYSKVRAITRVAVPEIEELLLRWADASTAAQLERIAADFRTVRRATDDPLDEDPIDPRYTWRTRTHGDGTMTVTIRGPVEECAELCAMIERRVERRDEIARKQEEELADPALDLELGDAGALAAPSEDLAGREVAESDHEVGEGVGDGEAIEGVGDGDAVIDARPGRPAELVQELVDLVAQTDPDARTDTSGLDRHTLVLHAPLEALHGNEPGLVPVEDTHGRVRGMDRRDLRCLGCEAGIILAAVDGDGTPMDIGQRDRKLTAALRRALRLRDRTCRFPGCDATRHLHAHHVHYWADGGPTDLANLVLLCAHHHRFVHQHDWTIQVRRDGQHRFARPNGDPVARRQRLQRSDRRLPIPHRDSLGRLQPSYVDVDRAPDRDTIVAVLHQEIERLAPDLVAA